MKSKVILFCVLLFCSKIVDSIPHSEDLVEQRVSPLSARQVNKNVPDGQYLGADFTRPRNLNIQQEKTQDYYTNQEKYNYDSNGYKRSPASSLSGGQLLGSYDSPADGGRFDSFPPRVESYPSQGVFDNQQYPNQNWQSQNQYTGPSVVLNPGDETPVVTTVHEPYRGSVQYVQPNYVESSNRRFYPPGRSFITRKRLQYPLTGKYVPNFAPPLSSSGHVPYEEYSHQVAASVRARPPGDRFATQSKIIYNETPAVIATLTDQSENIDYAKKYRSRLDVSNTAPNTNNDDGSPVIFAVDNYGSDSKPRNDPVSYESYREGQAAASEVKARPIEGQRYEDSFGSQSGTTYEVARDTLADQSEDIKHLQNYKSGEHLSNTGLITNHDASSQLISEADKKNSDSIPSNLAQLNSQKKAPVDISKILSEKPLARRDTNNYRSDDSGRNNIARDDSSNGAPVETETVAVKSGKYVANVESVYGPKEPVPINSYSEAPSAPTDTELLNSGINQYYHKLLTSGIKEFNLRSLTPDTYKKKYLVVHSNGTIEQIDKHDLGSHQNSKLRLVHTTRKNIDHSDSDGVPTQQSPENLPNNIAETPVPLNEYPLPTNNLPADNNKPTPLHVNPADKYDSNPSPSLKDLPADRSKLKPLPQPEKLPADDNNSKPLPSYVIPPADNDNSTPLTPSEDQSVQNNNFKPLPQDVYQPGDDGDLKPLPPHVNQSAADENSKPLLQDGNQPADGDNSKVLTPYTNQPDDDRTFYPNKKLHNKSKHTRVNPPADDKNSNTSSRNENQPANDNTSRPSNEYQSGDETDSTSLLLHKRQSVHNYKSKSIHSHYQPADDNLWTTPKPLTNPENKQGDDNDSKPLPAHATPTVNDTKSKPSNDQGGDNNNSNPSSPTENQPEEDKKSKPLSTDENEPQKDLKSELTSAIANNNDDQSNSTTISPSVPNYTKSTKSQVINTHKHKHVHRKSTTNSPVVSTTPYSDDTSEDQIITLSPIEQATDNVSDVPPAATTTTTTRPVKSSGKSNDIHDANNNQDDVQDDTTQTYSTTTVSPSSSASPTYNISDDKTIGSIEKKNTQINDKTVVDQVSGKKDTQTAVYNSSELFNTNTDVPAESDDYSSVTASPSVQNDVNTGDSSGDNSLELKQSETDVTITVSGSTPDSEDELLTINIEVSESTDDADSSSNDKSLVVSIDTNNDSDANSKTSKPEDCTKHHNNDDGRGKNLEIDMKNLKGDPTMWIRTTDQDLIDKLTAKNDTEFDVIYLFHIDNQPIIEREKETTIHCNGTVVTVSTEMTYAHKDDPTPKIERTTKIMQAAGYKTE